MTESRPDSAEVDQGQVNEHLEHLFDAFRASPVPPAYLGDDELIAEVRRISADERVARS